MTEINIKREFAMGENKNRITSSKDKTGSKNKFNTGKKQVKDNKISGNNDHKQQGSRPAKAKAQKATNVRSSANVAVVSTLIFHTRNSWK